MNSTQATTQTDARSRTGAANRLVFPHGVANLTIRVDRSMADRYRGEFSGPQPQVTQTPGVISVDYPRFNPLMWARTSAVITLSSNVAWDVEIRGGVAHWDGDLHELPLGRIDIDGGASHVSLRLPRPSGTLPIRITGGASHLTLRRPLGSAGRIEIGGGASKLALDEQSFGAVGGPIRLVSPGYSAGGDRVELEIGGGASRVGLASE